MEYIQRKRLSLDNLKKTNDEFNLLIKGKSVEVAYQIYKNNADKYKYNTPETKAEFFSMTGGSCSFCTKRIIDFNSEMTVEHIQTKVSAPSKIFEWNNLLCACRTCNTKRSTTPYDKAKYLDPTKVHDISKYFEFNMDGTIKIARGLTESEKEKAVYMRDMYQLDRKDLNTDRKEFLRQLVNDNEYYKILKNDDKSSTRIIFLSVFTYYKRRSEANGK
mgnify:FL=1